MSTGTNRLIDAPIAEGWAHTPHGRTYVDGAEEAVARLHPAHALLQGCQLRARVCVGVLVIFGHGGPLGGRDGIPASDAHTTIIIIMTLSTWHTVLWFWL